jgi:hypothetical protein
MLTREPRPAPEPPVDSPALGHLTRARACKAPHAGSMRIRRNRRPDSGRIPGMDSPSPSVKDLMRAYRESLEALKARGVIRSTKVLADYAEWLAATGLRLTLVEGGAQKGFDAVDAKSGLTYQVKARHVVLPYLQPDLRGQGSLDDHPFDYLVGVLLGADYEVMRAAVIPLEVVRERAKRIAYTNGYRVHMGSGILRLPNVRDVTAELQGAADS